MDVFTKAACFRAINLTLFGEEGTPQQRSLTLGTRKAGFCSVPVLPIVGHLCVVDTCFEKGQSTGLQFNLEIKEQIDKTVYEGTLRGDRNVPDFERFWVTQVRLILIIHRPHILQFAYLLKCICNPRINTCRVFRVFADRCRIMKNLSQLMYTFPS